MRIAHYNVNHKISASQKSFILSTQKQMFLVINITIELPYFQVYASPMIHLFCNRRWEERVVSMGLRMFVYVLQFDM